ncbi:leucine-rich repeat domain-containing protein [Parabacteroides sp. FAFU027]|uniref:leucine-rich repeat domain-containing protein n=1 Tax=Parabacteroides sp. FAFU027 TaxID=2922715 RepID=UPI001FAF15F1|nr:leucine-rich repeat domain-containing protein [Parabacteroides sp. FAFU027]
MKKLFLILCFVLLAAIANGAVSKSVNVTTVGTLNTLLTSTEKATVTDLTVTGTIDARDFKFMRDNMTMLTNLNISSINITSYSGDAGPSYSSSFPANQISEYAFYEKTSLKTIKLPASITSIGQFAFYQSGLTGSLTLPGNLKSIGYLAFYECPGLTGTIIIPKSVNQIDAVPFGLCSGITAFIVEDGNNYFTATNGVLFNKNQTLLILYPCGKTGNYEIPGTVNIIGKNSFAWCAGLTGSLIIPNSVTRIEDLAFNYCTGLSGILSIPNSVTYIGSYAFQYCEGLIGKITIPGSVTNLEDYSFSGCKSFTGDLIIPESVSTVGWYTFYDCPGLDGKVQFSETVTTIPYTVCDQCPSIKEVILPKCTKYISGMSFSGCIGLQKIKSANPLPPSIKSSSFEQVNKSTCQLIVPIGARTAYQAAPYWSEFTNITEQDLSAGITTTKTDICKVYSSNGQNIIENATNESIEVFTLSGVLVKTINNREIIKTINLPKGTYIVKVGNNYQKVECVK